MTRPCFLRAALSTALMMSALGCAASLPRIESGLGPHLFGAWDWRRSVGGIAGRTETPETRRRSERLMLGEYGEYQIFHGDTLLAEGRFRIAREKTRLRPDSVYVIRWDGLLPFHPVIAELPSPDSLRLTDLCVDCFEHLYARIRR